MQYVPPYQQAWAGHLAVLTSDPFLVCVFHVFLVPYNQ